MWAYVLYMKTTATKLSDAQTALLKFLVVQSQAAAEYVGFSPYLIVGYAGCHALTGQALIARKLVDVAQVGSQERITINDAGREALAAVAS